MLKRQQCPFGTPKLTIESRSVTQQLNRAQRALLSQLQGFEYAFCHHIFTRQTLLLLKTAPPVADLFVAVCIFVVPAGKSASAVFHVLPS